jgi:hypothetical protein
MKRLGAADTREAAGRVPRPRTSFVGRERELGSARCLLDCTKLLTLTGPGGSGKTRLSIALAARVEAEFRSGFALVRPDGILAARGFATDTHRVVDYLRRLSGRGEPEPTVAVVRSEVAVP